MTYISKLADPYSSHTKIVSLARTLGKGLKILDIGCARGYIASELAGDGHQLFGIETNPQWAKEARKHFSKVSVGDIETMTVPYPKASFDLIICADVIEHLRDPEKALVKIVSYLKPGGHIILSTGNVANLYIRLSLLVGKFDYKERGILDRTHVRLFTFRTFRELITGAKLRIVKKDVTPIPLPIVMPSTAKGRPLHAVHVVNHAATKVWPSLMGFQAIYLAQKGTT